MYIILSSNHPCNDEIQGAVSRLVSFGSLNIVDNINGHAFVVENHVPS